MVIRVKTSYNIIAIKVLKAPSESIRKISREAIKSVEGKSINERILQEQPLGLRGHNYDIKIIILFPFLFIIRIIILCGVIMGEMVRSDKRSPATDTQPFAITCFEGSVCFLYLFALS